MSGCVILDGSIAARKNGKRLPCEALQAENAKLRELIHDMFPFAEAGMDNTCVTRSCCMFDKCTSEAGDKCLIEEHIAARMRELGVEVDE